MSSFLAMMLYIDYKCDTQPGFRKAFLVLTLIFVLLLWSPWRPFLRAAVGVSPALVGRADSASQFKARASFSVHSQTVPQTKRRAAASDFAASLSRDGELDCTR